MSAGEPAISVRGVGKCYEIFSSPTQRLKQAVTGKKYGREFWALRDVSFDVYPGESVGIIGRNGSGKSTLMQIIAGTLTPTTGEVHIRGRIAALLELGSGFNPHFTGRENAILSGSIMGVPRKRMEEKLPEIEEFAEIGDFLDEPVSVYSSGMHARLAFAVSVSLEPDILILDEILSVGDAGFQQRCIGRLHQLLSNGVTLLFVSHAADAVKSICKKGLLLKQGDQEYFGASHEAVDRYFAMLRTLQSARTVKKYEELAAAKEAEVATAKAPAALETEGDSEAVENGGGFAGRYGTGHAKFESVRMLDEQGQAREAYAFGEMVHVEAVFRAAVAIPKLDVILKVRDKAGVDLFGVSVNEERPKGKIVGVSAGQVVRVGMSFRNNLRSGPHGVSVSLIRPPDAHAGGGEGVVTLDHIDTAAAFVVLPRPAGLVRGKFQQEVGVEWATEGSPVAVPTGKG